MVKTYQPERYNEIHYPESERGAEADRRGYSETIVELLRAGARPVRRYPRTPRSEEQSVWCDEKRIERLSLEAIVAIAEVDFPNAPRALEKIGRALAIVRTRALFASIPRLPSELIRRIAEYASGVTFAAYERATSA